MKTQGENRFGFAISNSYKSSDCSLRTNGPSRSTLAGHREGCFGSPGKSLTSFDSHVGSRFTYRAHKHDVPSSTGHSQEIGIDLGYDIRVFRFYAHNARTDIYAFDFTDGGGDGISQCGCRALEFHKGDAVPQIQFDIA